jgi:hypothetical protein
MAVCRGLLAQNPKSLAQYNKVSRRLSPKCSRELINSFPFRSEPADRQAVRLNAAECVQRDQIGDHPGRRIRHEYCGRRRQTEHCDERYVRQHAACRSRFGLSSRRGGNKTSTVDAAVSSVLPAPARRNNRRACALHLSSSRQASGTLQHRSPRWPLSRQHPDCSRPRIVALSLHSK